MLLILCPLSSELKYVAQFMKLKGVDLDAIHSKGDKKLYKSKGFYLGQGGHGKVEYALALQSLLFKYPEIDRVIGLGCAGSLDPEVEPFSVVLGEKTAEHDYLEKFEPHAEVPHFQASSSLLEWFKDVSIDGFHIFRGNIGSGDEDITSADRVLDIRERTGAIAVAWEGAGGARACRAAKKDYLEIRGITDLCTAEAGQDFSANLKQAMENATSLLLKVFQAES